MLTKTTFLIRASLVLFIISFWQSAFALDSLWSFRFNCRDSTNNRRDIAIENVGYVENHLMYGARTKVSSDRSIKILDFAQLDTTADWGYVFPKVVGALKRTGKSDNIKFHKSGSTLFYGDSNCLRVFDVTDMQNPVEIDSVICGRFRINTIHQRNDTLYLGKTSNSNIFPSIFIVTYKNNKLELKDSLMHIDGYNGCMLENSYMSFDGIDVYSHIFPLTSRYPDYTFSLSNNNIGDAMTIYKNYAFIATRENGIIKYDVSDISNFIPVDTLPVTGVRSMKIFKNLLLACGNKLHIFDISDINHIEYVAVYLVGGSNFFPDSVSNFVYSMQWNSSPTIDRVDIGKYVKTISVAVSEPVRKGANTSPLTVRYSRKGSVLSLDHLTDITTISIVDPRGRVVHTLTPSSQDAHTFRLNRSIPPGAYYAVIKADSRVYSRMFVVGE